MFFIVYDIFTQFNFERSDILEMISCVRYIFILPNICKEFGKLEGSSKWIKGCSIQRDETKKSKINDSESTTNQNVSTNNLV